MGEIGNRDEKTAYKKTRKEKRREREWEIVTMIKG